MGWAAAARRVAVASTAGHNGRATKAVVATVATVVAVTAARVAAAGAAAAKGEPTAAWVGTQGRGSSPRAAHCPGTG